MQYIWLVRSIFEPTSELFGSLHFFWTYFLNYFFLQLLTFKACAHSEINRIFQHGHGSSRSEKTAKATTQNLEGKMVIKVQMEHLITLLYLV